MTGLAIHFGIWVFLGLGNLGLRDNDRFHTRTPTDHRQRHQDGIRPMVFGNQDATGPRTVVPTKTKQAPYSVMVRGGEVVCRKIAYEYVNMAERGKTTALQHVANTIYIRLNAPLVYVSARERRERSCGMPMLFNPEL